MKTLGYAHALRVETFQLTVVIFKTVFVDVSLGRHDHVISLINKDRSLNDDSAVTQLRTPLTFLLLLKTVPNYC